MKSSADFSGDFRAGEIVGETYLVLGYLGRGAMGHLYHVRHRILSSEYALKTLSTGQVNENAWRRFQNEAHAISIMQHPNLVAIYNLGLHQGVLPFYVMDLLKGQDLAHKLEAQGPLDCKAATRLFIEVSGGISYAHKKGIIHRDIKPGNIFLLDTTGATGETVKVVDFGIAKLAVTKDPQNQALTKMGDVVGTPLYMSPEQCLGDRVDARSDVYSLACTLFEALTGRPPFRGRNAAETMLAHQSAPPPSLSKASGGKDFPPEIEYLIARALAKLPSERHQSMDALQSDLNLVLKSGEPLAIAHDAKPVKVPALQPERLAGLDMPQRQSKHRSPILVPLVVAALGLIAGLTFWSFNAPTSPKAYAPRPADDPSSTAANLGSQLKVLENSKSSKDRDADQPFSIIQTINGNEIRCFDFPEETIIGKIKDWYSTDWIKASGLIQFPASSYLTFCPNPIIAHKPEYLKHFRDDEIYCLQFAPGGDTDEMINAALNIKGLKQFDFTDSTRMINPPVALLKKFPNMEWFVGSKIQNDGALLAQTKGWGKMHGVFVPLGKNMLPLLKEVQTSRALYKLGLGPCHLGAAELRVIARMSGLTMLDISGNPVTSEELTTLLPLKKLNELHLLNTDVDVSAIDSLKKFPNLKTLYISSRRLNTVDLRKIGASLPNLTSFQSKR